MKKDVSNIIDNINKIVADASKSIIDTAASVSKDYLAADTSLKNYVDEENIKINQKLIIFHQILIQKLMKYTIKSIPIQVYLKIQ